MAEEPLDLRIDLANKKFLLKEGNLPEEDKIALKSEVLEAVKKHNLLPIYKCFYKELGWEVDQELVSVMQKFIDDKLIEFDAKAKDAEENLGETEVRDAMLAKAMFLSEVGDKENTVEAFKAVNLKAVGVGSKIDMTLNQIRLFLFHGDLPGARDLLENARRLCTEGGDWERKNKLKVYSAAFAAATRDLSTAADLFLESVTTFTTTELLSFDLVVAYAVVTGLLTLSRTVIKKRIIDSPEVTSILEASAAAPPTDPSTSSPEEKKVAELKKVHTFVHKLLRALYFCEYEKFFEALTGVAEWMQKDLLLHKHVRYFLREIRYVAYSQFLESYKSVTLNSMADAFRVTPEFLDTELAAAVAAGRLSAQIDRVAGIVETNRQDQRATQFHQVVKQGDALLSRVQRLAGVIHLE
mmetsp:Transcript_10068/g.18660  ORF Transcript_10068/g.18660 Transcript_10068/m.18660 type:complete len:411 (-) Transcript_10068:251-1483(-)|eukprot:CAMPEP_0175046212 /NCGR_PEP_ID=MMETSP0052_2-20121109/4898_1 /TAXON_ID=51329 ORGANISM="Polytomella parva, Strain SAG 63-3" /NCGR_SAMPLE_ID=MMETSP0052_2 /ASSEMBLY_ACC=CAM_ASM_000194 /LENGTH=410 /DNA_ID=CAMNT_0016309919 /DNA_START=101 /DNA_END=1333 /DNA_ORIENTATION=+